MPSITNTNLSSIKHQQQYDFMNVEGSSSSGGEETKSFYGQFEEVPQGAE